MSIPQTVQVTMSGTSSIVEFPNVPLQYKQAILSAKASNSGPIYVGSVVSAFLLLHEGYILDPGKQVPVLLENFNQIWATGNDGDILTGIGA